MKIVFNLISIAMVIAVIFLASLNAHTIFGFTVWVTNGSSIVYQIAISKVVLAFFIAGILTGTFWAVAFYMPIQKKLKEYQRKLEKTSVQTDEESSKVAVLEAKIATLEKALQAALEKDGE